MDRTDERMEDLVRRSLRARADDVEPTPALWQEVDRRIARRRRWLVAGWALAGAAAVTLAAVAVPSLLATGPRVPEITPADPAPADPAPADPAPDPGAPAGLPAPAVTVAGRDLVLVGPDGPVPLVTLPAEGESTFLAVAVRPGSSTDDLTVATTTTAERMFDLRWTRVADGELVVAFEAFTGAYGATLGATDVSGPVWAPDGSALAWVEEGRNGTVLRTVGWSDTGPGTGDPATDNVAFALDVSPGLALAPQDWTWIDGDRSRITLASPEPGAGWWELTIDRQADGAWSLAPPADGAGPLVEVAAPAGVDGNVAAVVRTGDGVAAGTWIVAVSDAGVVVHHLDAAALRAVATLPGDVLPGDGLPELWASAAGVDAVLVGGRGTGVAVLVTADGAVAALPVAANGGSIVR